MAYQLTTPINQVDRLGHKTTQLLGEQGVHTVKDLLLFVPLRYEDRSQFVTIADAPHDELITLSARVVSFDNQFRGRKSIQKAVLRDNTGTIKANWFNSPFLTRQLQPGKELLFSGKITKYGLTQPKVEAAQADPIHTGRLVPIYSSSLGLKQGYLRRYLKTIFDDLVYLPKKDWEPLSLEQALLQLHFPDSAPAAIAGRERLALEELITLIATSHRTKANWQNQHTATQLQAPKQPIPDSIPFQLTADQHTAINEILADLTQPHPMNRLLVGDVGSGKTVVAGTAAYHLVQQGQMVVLAAPTRILAQQHSQTLLKLFPDLETSLLLGGDTNWQLPTQPSLVISTHAVLKQLDTLKPALVIFDEQHRFGVSHRTVASGGTHQPHQLTMSATPIPRSLMLTIFSHLSLSMLSQLPPGRLPTTTWAAPASKRQAAYRWLLKEVATHPTSKLALIVCPFIKPSDSDQFKTIAAVEPTYEHIKQLAAKISDKLVVELLHGQLKVKHKDELTTRLFDNQINVLVTTPVIEVGLDVPTASIVMIESAERFGLASLHQLRGRVGRAGQQGECVVMPSIGKPNQRLLKFSQETNGLKLAEWDLQQRGAGDLFGTDQTGFEGLRFASWTNQDLIQQAHQVYQDLKNRKLKWRSSIFTTQKSTQVAAN